MRDALLRLDPWDYLPLVYLALAVAVLGWNVLIAGQIARLPRTAKWFSRLAGVIGLLLAPAIVVAIAVASYDGARTVRGVAWIWPLLCGLIVIQSAWATIGRMVSSAVGAPILCYNIALFVLSITDYLLATRGTAPTALLGLVAGRDTVLGLFFGRAALASPLALQLPLLVPASPARYRASATVRALLVLTATAAGALLVLEWPRGVGAVRSYAPWATDQLQERAASEFAVGVRLLPVLGDSPKVGPVRNDLALADSLDPQAVLLVLAPEAARGVALDSISRIIDVLRGDSTRILIGLAMGPDETRRARARGAQGTAERLAALERITRRLRPDVVFPGWEPAMPGVIVERPMPPEWWRPYLVRAARTVRGVRPRTQVALSLSRLDLADSVLLAWAQSQRTRDTRPIDVVAAQVMPSFSGAPAVDARLRALDRWLVRDIASASPPLPLWVAAASALPRAHGDESQRVTLLHVMAWATRRPVVRGVIVGDAGDYEAATGLRAADGRLRPAVRTVMRVTRGLRERSGAR
ncbi:MAG: hypothetical protein MUF00_09670 [Gemmatimonadaceae bacterium]|jgi:hypothetical protein|nr:hypothetical protein [Gemmatimonadaceae bacterium]